MMPVNRYMDSYSPLHGNQMPFNQNYYPCFEPVPPVANVDPSKSVVTNHPWLYPNNLYYSFPCYPHCRQNNFPGYYSYGPCPHFAPPQFHCCGNHSPFPGVLPVQYVSPPHYLRELPSYEYDKPRDNGFHCCGCRDHTHDQRNGGSVGIKDLKANAENKMDDFLVPFSLKSNPYPVLWIPPEYVKNEEHRKPLESDMVREEKSEKSSLDTKPPQIKLSEQDPGVWSSWFPLDKRNLQSLIQSGNGRSTADQKNADNMRQFPFPIIWMPSYNRQGEAEKKENVEMAAAPKFPEEPASGGKLLPVDCTNNDDSMNKPQATHENSGGQVDLGMKEKTSKQRSIPVKQMEEPKEKDNSEGVERRGRDASMKNADNGMGKATESSKKRQSSCPPKTSKLPPVCLRVDPLPRKKNGNTTSRSPSPPGFKRESKETEKDAPVAPISLDSKANNSQNLQAQEGTLSSRMEAEGKRNKVKVIEVEQSKTGEDKDEEQKNIHQTQQFPVTSSVDSEEEASSSLGAEKSEKKDDNRIIKEDEGLRNADGLATQKANDDLEPKKDKELSEEEAAVRIQSAYRGFEIRKWDSLKKMKQIAKVQEQVAEVRNKICGLESSPDLQKDDRHRAVIGEMIMSLLLKLDTIQGLHPSLRDVRKSLARELVGLQEKLDLLAKAKSSENYYSYPNNITGIEAGQNGDIAEHPSNDGCQMMDVVSDTKGMEASKPPLVVSEEQRKSECDVFPVFRKIENHSDGPEDSGVGEIEQSLQLPIEESGSEQNVGAQLENTCGERINEGRSEPFEMNESKHMDNNAQVSKRGESPEEVTDEEPTASSEKQSQRSILGVRRKEEGESDVSGDLTSQIAVIDEMIMPQIPEMDLLKELPVGVVDDEELEKHVQTEIQDNEVSPGDVESEAAIDNLELQSKELHEGGQLTIHASSLDGVVESMTQSEQQPMELLIEVPTETEASSSSPDEEVPIQTELKQQGVNERLSVAETYDWLEVASEKEDGCPGNAVAEGAQALFNKGNEEMEESSTEETQGAPKNLSQVQDAQIGEDQDNIVQLTATDGNEENIQEEKELHVMEMVNGYEEVGNQHNGLETSDVEPIIEVQVNAVPAKHDKKKEEVVPASSAVKEREIDMENDRKLIEENEKMREMVEKLIEAGKEQLAVISSLTGRVKDLEKKMTRKKRRSARRCRTTVSSTYPRNTIK